MSQVKRIFTHGSDSVSASKVCNLQCPSFDTIDDLQLSFGNSGAAATLSNILSSINRIEVTIDGQNWVSAPIALLANLYTFMGNKAYTGTAQKNVFSLNIAKLMFDKPEDREFFAIGCLNVETIQVRVYCGTTVTGVTDVTLKTVRRSIQSSLGSYIQIIDYPQMMTAAGVSTVETLPKDSTDSYLLCAVAANGGTITQGECILNGNSIINLTSQNEMDMNAQLRGFAPVSGIFPYLFADGTARSVLPMQGITDLRLKTTFSVAPTGGQYDILAVSIKNTPAAVIEAVAAV